jgi:signal recognition particle receptor subunit beta
LEIEDRVRAFQVRASRDAQVLARILAGAPVLTPSLISVLQSRLLPETGPSELAEVLVSGLLEQSPSLTVSRREARFQFRTSVSELLRRGTTAAHEWDTFQAISEYLEQNPRTGNSILALVADPRGRATVDADLEPFAAVGRAVAIRLGIARADAGLSNPGEPGDVPVAVIENEPRKPIPHLNENEMYKPGSENPVSEESPPAHDVPRTARDANPWQEVETDGEESRLVRPYAVTGGRTQPRYQLALEALVVSTVLEPRDLSVLAPECQAILEYCRDWKSVAEISAVLQLPLGIARILIADMGADGLVRIHQRRDSEGRPDRDLLVRVLGGLRGSRPSVPVNASNLDPLKVVVAGGFGVGKSTFVGSVSEFPPFTTEAAMSVASTDVDDLSFVPDKQTMTAAMDFGRITLDEALVLYIFGTPGPHRFWFLWDDIIQGAIGAVVLVDTRRLADSFPPVDYFEASGMPFVIAVNAFHGQVVYSLDDVREALALPSSVPVIPCDARNRESVRASLVTLIEHVMSVAAAEPGPRSNGSLGSRSSCVTPDCSACRMMSATNELLTNSWVCRLCCLRLISLTYGVERTAFDIRGAAPGCAAPQRGK